MKTPLILITLCLGMLSLSSCETTKEAKQHIEGFLNYVVNQDFKEASVYVSSQSSHGQDVVANCKLMYENTDYGKLLSFEKGFGTSTNISNSVSTVNLNYNLIYEKGEVTYNFVVVDRGAGFKIEAIQ